MVLKIDTYELAKACDDAMERRFPKAEYNDASNVRKNGACSSMDIQSRNGQMCVLSQTNNASIVISKRRISHLTHKPKKGLFGKALQTPVSEVKLLLNDVISASEASLSHTGFNIVFLYVLDEDISKFDNLLCVDGNKLIDLADYIRSNNIAVYEFEIGS